MTRALNDVMSFRRYEGSCKFIRYYKKDSAVYFSIFFGYNLYKLVRYARKTIIPLLPVKTGKSGPRVTV